MKKINNTILGMIVIILFTGFSFQTTEFNGIWECSSTASQFTLYLSQNGTTLSGSHCSVFQNGEKIDCRIDPTDLSIQATDVGTSNTVTVNFKSYFKNLSGKATLKKISETQIEWTITEKPQGEYYIPNTATLTKQ
ncbi:MAG TPA: hypothetical protein VMY77_03725 [Chitinophagaceae bacterium]|nr:hypothetical protein [Chitinophagaceae bacterium]